MPVSYRWFRSDLDKYTVFTLNTMVPIVLMWLVVRAPDDQTHWGYFYAVILFGQVWVASNVLLGIHMFQRHSRKLRRDLANAMLAIQEAKATQDVSKPLDDSKS